MSAESKIEANSALGKRVGGVEFNYHNSTHATWLAVVRNVKIWKK